MTLGVLSAGVLERSKEERLDELFEALRSRPGGMGPILPVPDLACASGMGHLPPRTSIGP